jgi:hypothetical protein
MWDNVIGQHIRRCNKNLLVMNLVVLAIVLVSVGAAQRYFYNCFAGPFPMSHDDLARVTDPDSQRRYFVSIDQLAPVDTGLEDVERTRNKYTREVTSEKVTAHYYAAPLGNKYLLIKSPSSAAAAAYTGALSPLKDDVRSWFQTQKLDAKNLKFDEVFLPFLVDATSFRTGTYVGLAFAIPFGLLAVYNIAKAVKRRGNMEASPIVKKMAKRFVEPPAVIAQMIDQDIKTTGNASPVKGVILSSSWLLRKGAFRLDVLHVNDIVWIYQKVTKHYTNAIPTGKTFTVVIRDKWGGLIEVAPGRGRARTRSAKTVDFLQLLASRLPWVITGFSADLKRQYDKNRAQFVAAVDQRRGGLSTPTHA